MVGAADAGQPCHAFTRQDGLRLCVADAVLIGLDHGVEFHAALVGQAPPYPHWIAQVFERFGHASERPVCKEPLPVTGIIVVPIDPAHAHPVETVYQLRHQIFGEFDPLAVVGEVHQGREQEWTLIHVGSL